MIDLTAAGRAFFIIQIRINQARGIVNIFLEFQRIFAEIVHQAEQFTGQIQAQLGGQHFGDGGGFGEVGGKRLFHIAAMADVGDILCFQCFPLFLKIMKLCSLGFIGFFKNIT